MTGRLRRLALGIATLALLAPASSSAAQTSASQQLVEDYAPIVMVREQQDPPCDTKAEQYEPTTVTTMLGNPAVELTEVIPGRGAEDLKSGPTAADIAGKGDQFHLDIPGEPLGDTCVYARDFEKLKEEGRAPVTTYAHIARQVGHPGLVVQYWFFWYFNQFNDLHEGDWEGMQIIFDAPNARQALAQGPGEMVLFQHAGGERADWDRLEGREGGDAPGRLRGGRLARDLLRRDDLRRERPGRVRGRLRQHQRAAAPARARAGRGADLPHHHRPLQVADLLRALGREGERGSTTARPGRRPRSSGWNRSAWQEKQRTTSPRLPGGSVVGFTPVAGAFCGAVAEVSNVINLDQKTRLGAVVTVVAPILALLLLFGLTRWGPVDLTDLRQRRSFGQLVRASRQLYGRHWRTLVPIGLTAIPVLYGISLLAGLIGGGTGAEDDDRQLGPRPGARRPPGRHRPADRLHDRRRRGDRRRAPGRRERDGWASPTPSGRCGAGWAGWSPGSCWR